MARPSPCPGAQRERGQATVELALLLPLLLTLVLLVVQIGLVVRDQVLLVHTTREVARAAAVGPRDPPAPPPGGLDPSRLTLEVSTDGRLVRAAGVYRTPIVVPLLSALRQDIALHATLAMRAEWP